MLDSDTYLSTCLFSFSFRFSTSQMPSWLNLRSIWAPFPLLLLLLVFSTYNYCNKWHHSGHLGMTDWEPHYSLKSSLLHCSRLEEDGASSREPTPAQWSYLLYQKMKQAGTSRLGFQLIFFYVHHQKTTKSTFLWVGLSALQQSRMNHLRVRYSCVFVYWGRCFGERHLTLLVLNSILSRIKIMMIIVYILESAHGKRFRVTRQHTRFLLQQTLALVRQNTRDGYNGISTLSS